MFKNYGYEELLLYGEICGAMVPFLSFDKISFWFIGGKEIGRFKF